ncbi:biosynthetic-type acetolactate synthase large subunit [Clostridium sp. 29_15]|uniref:biosynthetic-type acetolactate synthase large subunit n=1 Tax=Clostridium sp. 29_15 TaxID=1896982 RepID=UPI0009664B9E|nr:biosynthetic-type acetolactate synthase large subunit [Clostridium sp. 29_15]OKZ87903.1 MAG: acetolactate synthase, large subunit, biosynthetic type [Clostridium sp. 29_15]
MLLTGAEILVNSLIDNGVDTVFGYPGGAVLNIYDALFKKNDKIRHILTCHEQGAAHAADGYARSTGKVGVCIATSGPGATNLVTGIATAYMDSTPMVAITGNVTRPLLGKDSFQEVDITGITMPITKHNYIVKDIKDLQKIINEAFYIASSGRHGPVLIDIPKDITAEKYNYITMEPKNRKKSLQHININSLERFAQLINESENPFIYAGGGILSSNAEKEVLVLAEKINAPVATSLMGIGSIPNDHRLYTGMIGMHGTKASNLLATSCDLIIALGARFSDRVISHKNHIKNAKIIQIDIDPTEINKNVKVDSYIVGDIKEVLKKLFPMINEKENIAWINKMNELKALNNKEVVKEGVLTPEYLFTLLNKMNNGNFIITTEVGQHQMWTAQNYKFYKPRTFISSCGLGTMGFGMGASIGAQMGNPKAVVFNIAGDGSFGMDCNEFATAVNFKLPIKVIVMNNNALGMVRQWQSLFYEGRYAETTLNRATDFVKLAEAFGGNGFRVEKPEELQEILEKALATDGPVIIDYKINSDDMVFPMVAPGAPINEIISKEDIKL